MADRMTAEELAAIREMLAETSTDPERRLLDELDAVMREQTQAQKRIKELEAERDEAKRHYLTIASRITDAERRGYERGLDIARHKSYRDKHGRYWASVEAIVDEVSVMYTKATELDAERVELRLKLADAERRGHERCREDVLDLCAGDESLDWLSNAIRQLKHKGAEGGGGES